MDESVLSSWDAVEELYEADAPVAPERAWSRPADADNPYNAWYVTTSITDGGTGPLAGRTVAIKDNTAVAGVPMTNGSATVDGFVPLRDATIVRRTLDAGATIAGKAVCADLCFSGASITANTGDVENPWDTVDHVGPITRTVSDAALMLSVIAGADGLDPRQPTNVTAGDYLGALEQGATGLRVGVLREGFGLAESEPEVDAAVREAVTALSDAGMVVTEVSVPWHRHGPRIWDVIATEGATAQMIDTYGYGLNWKGLYDPEVMDHYGARWTEDGSRFADTVKLVLLAGKLRAFALAVAAYHAGQYEWSEFQLSLIASIRRWEADGAHEGDEPWSYYEHWLTALETVLAGNGLLSEADLDDRTKAALATPRTANHHEAHREPVAIDPAARPRV